MPIITSIPMILLNRTIDRVGRVFATAMEITKAPNANATPYPNTMAPPANP